MSKREKLDGEIEAIVQAEIAYVQADPGPDKQAARRRAVNAYRRMEIALSEYLQEQIGEKNNNESL